MKQFFSIKAFKENRIFYIFFSILGLLFIGISNSSDFPHLEYFDWRALVIALFVWGLSSLLDKRLYFNFWCFLTSTIFAYWAFWFMFLLFK